MSDDLPGWLEPGSDVVVVTMSGGFRSTPRMTTTTVEKVGKRDIVCADGSRWNRTRIRQNFSGHEYVQGRSQGAWSHAPDLYPADSPQVAEFNEERRLADLRTRAIGSADELLTSIRRENYDEAQGHLATVTKALEALR